MQFCGEDENDCSPNVPHDLVYLLAFAFIATLQRRATHFLQKSCYVRRVYKSIFTALKRRFRL